MAVVKKNTYEAGVNNDVTNVVQNVDLNRLGIDNTKLDGSPLEVQIGSIIECNGSLYAVEGAVESITNIGTAFPSYIYFDSSTESFIASTEVPLYNSSKNGYYSPTVSTRRATKWYNITGNSAVIRGEIALGIDFSSPSAAPDGVYFSKANIEHLSTDSGNLDIGSVDASIQISTPSLIAASVNIDGGTIDDATIRTNTAPVESTSSRNGFLREPASSGAAINVGPSQTYHDVGSFWTVHVRNSYFSSISNVQFSSLFAASATYKYTYMEFDASGALVNKTLGSTVSDGTVIRTALPSDYTMIIHYTVESFT